MDLDPGPVELPLDRSGADRVHRLGHRARGLRQHRLNRGRHRQADLGQSTLAGGRGHECRPPQITRQHRRTTHRRLRDVERLGDGVGDDALQGALSQLACEQGPQEPLLGLGRPGEHLSEHPAALGLRVGTGDVGDRSQELVDLRDGEARLAGRFDIHLGDGRPPDTDATLSRAPRDEANHDREQIGIAVGEQPGDGSSLVEPAGCGGDRTRHVHDVGQQHDQALRMGSTPTARNSWASGASGRPMTLDGDPVTDSTKTAPSPCNA